MGEKGDYYYEETIYRMYASATLFCSLILLFLMLTNSLMQLWTLLNNYYRIPEIKLTYNRATGRDRDKSHRQKHPKRILR